MLKNLLRWLILAIVTIMLSGCGSFEIWHANRAYRKGDYGKAFRIWTSLAENGVPEAQRGLGMLYQSGLGVARDPTKAAWWYKSAAEQGDVISQLNFGLMHETGDGMPTDHMQAFTWFSLAAAQGNSAAEAYMRSASESLTVSEIYEAQQFVKVWKPKPATTLH